MTSPRFAAWGDRLSLVLLLVTIAVEFTGGIKLGQGEFRLSITSGWRLVLYTIGVVILRHLVVRHPSLRERLIARRQARSSAGWPGLRLALPTRQEWLAASAILAAATAWALREQIRTLSGVPDYGDPLFSMWRLSAIAHNLVTDPWHLFDGNMYFPATNTLAYSDAILLPGLVAAPFVLAGAPVALVYGAMVVLSFLLAGLSMFLLARAVTHRFAPALLAGVLFALYPYRFSSYSHLEKLGTFFMPLALLLLVRVLQTGGLKEGLALGLVIALQALWSMYLGVFLAIGLTAFALVRWAGGHFLWRERARSLIAGALLTVAVVGPCTLPYVRARAVVGERQRGEVLAYSATRADYVTVSPRSRLYGGVLPAGENGERHLFPGLTALAFAGVALVPPFSPMAGAALGGLFVSVDGALGVNGAVFSWLYDWVPPFRGFRAPARFSTVIGLFLSLLAAFGLARLLGRHPGRSRRLVAAAVIALAVFELQPSLGLLPLETRPPAIYGALPDRGDAVLVELPVEDAPNPWDFIYIYNSTFHHRRLLNGSSGFVPPAYLAVVDASRAFPSAGSIDALRLLGADFAVVHGDFFEPDRYRAIVDALDGRSDVTLVAGRPSPRGREDRLYRLR